jgi:thioredoxin 2
LFAGRPVALTDESFDRHLSRSEIPLVVDFWAPWCAPCRMMAPFFEQAAAELEPHVRLAKVNTDENPRLGGRYQISSIPTTVVFEGGREVARQPGAMNLPQLLRWIRMHA